MDNQHTKIKGYRDLSQEEIDLMNEVKQKEAELGELYQRMESNPDLDQRWLAIARSNWEFGFMAAVRSVAKPDTTFNQ